jgi:hypothetical protein
MKEIELITKALKDAYKFVKEQEQTKETGELLINLFKAEILVKNCSIPAVMESVCSCSKGKGIDHDEDGKAYCIDCGNYLEQTVP